MKKIFTNLSRCFSALAITVTVLANAFSASAEEYKSMIRYDRVWECRSFETAPGYNDGVNKCMKFDGTEEINGKIYHRLVTFRKAYPIIEIGGDIISYKIEDCYENEGYMREENGKVYTLFVPYDDSERDYFVGRLYQPDSETLVNQSNCYEYMIYDLTLNEGDTYTAMSFLTMAADLTTFKVIDVSSCEIDGEDLKVMKVGWLLDYESMEPNCIGEYSIVEGVGAIDYGCLNHYEFSDHLTKIWYWNYFLRLFNIDGDLLYNADYTGRYENLDWGSFVSEVEEVKSKEANSPIYDILGRQIANPAPGQLYIQAGKKHIAK